MSIARVITFAFLLHSLASRSDAATPKFPWTLRPILPCCQWQEQVLLPGDSSFAMLFSPYRTALVTDTSQLLSEARDRFSYGSIRTVGGAIKEIDFKGFQDALGPAHDSVLEIRWSERIITSNTALTLLGSALFNATVAGIYASIFHGKRNDPLIVGLILTGIEIPFYFPQKHRLVIPKATPAK